MSPPDNAEEASPQTEASPAQETQETKESSHEAQGEPAPSKPKVVRKRSQGPLIALVVVVIIVAAGVAGAYETHFLGWGKPTTVATCFKGTTLYGEGGAFIGSLVDAWGYGYSSSSDNTVSYDPAGSGAGVTGLTDQLQDFASTDEPLNTSETAALPGPVLTLPVAGGALTVLYNLPGWSGGTNGLHLTGAILAQIYSGQITTWNAPAIQAINTATLPNEPITVVYRTDAAGLTFVLTNLLSDDSTAWRTAHGTSLTMPVPATSNKLGESGNTKMLSDVSTISYAIGYSDLSDTLTEIQSEPALQYAALGNFAGNYILPTVETTATAIEHLSANISFPAATGNWAGINMVNASGVNDYPAATLGYFLVYQSETPKLGYNAQLSRDQVIHQWLTYVVSGTAQALANDYDFVPLSSQLVSIDQAGLSAMTYNGAALPACT